MNLIDYSRRIFRQEILLMMMKLFVAVHMMVVDVLVGVVLYLLFSLLY